MSKTAKFLLCENPIAEKSDGRVFILHNRKPLLFAEVHSFHGADENGQMELKRSLTAYGTLEYDIEYMIFAPLWMVPDDKFSQSSAQQQADTTAGILRRMADWYEAYLIWEDSQQDLD